MPQWNRALAESCLLHTHGAIKLTVPLNHSVGRSSDRTLAHSLRVKARDTAWARDATSNSSKTLPHTDGSDGYAEEL